MTRTLADTGFRGPFAAADARVIHNAGGSEAQELAYALSVAIAYWRALEAGGVEMASAEVTMVPQNTVECDEAAAATVMKLVDALEDHDDVQKVYHNADIAEEVMAKLA